MILSLLFILNAVNAQTLSWNKPEPRKNEQSVVISSEPTGYRILYEIQREHNKCLQYVGIRPKYSLDLGNVMKYDLETDINFIKGATYYIAIVSYTIQPITENEKDVGYRVIESPATSHACVVIRGIPEGVEFEGVYNEEYINNYKEENENEEIIIASASVPGADGASGISESDLESRSEGYKQRGDNGPSDIPTLLGPIGSRIRPSDRDRSAAADKYFARRDNRNDNVEIKPKQTGVVSGPKILSANDSDKDERSGRRDRIGQVGTSVQDNAEKTENSERFDGAVIFLIAGATICGACLVKG